MAIAYINIGSNIGDRLSLCARAVARIEALIGHKAKVSDPYHSKPWGYVSDHDFINIGLTIEVGDMDACSLLALLLKAQHEIDHGASHRTASGDYADRLIDIDLIALGDTAMQSDALTLPHRHMGERLFVLVPMAQLWPQWRHPITGLTPDEMIERLSTPGAPGE